MAESGTALRVGLTGGIGSGKSTVGSLLAKQGAYLIDADAISRSCTAPGGLAMASIASQFGPVYVAPDGGLDRAAMRALVFSDPQAKKTLESIIHPLVVKEIARQSAEAEQSGCACIVTDIPLLVESGHWRARLHRVLVVDCLPQTQIDRVYARNQIPSETVEQIMATQASRARRLSAADAVIFNDAISLKQLGTLVHKIGRQFGL